MQQNMSRRLQHSTGSDTAMVAFRGSSTLASAIKEYDSKLRKGDALVQQACQKELRAFESARSKLQKRVESVMKSKELVALQDEAEDLESNVSKSMRSVAREVRDMQAGIEDDVSLSDAEKDKKLAAIREAAAMQFDEMSRNYPAAMRAHVLNSARVIM